ncbi:hypothetical protein Tco_0822735 [Tanacetum coccineum]|uniref:Reverse transcriptase n=1 Tax=Tanacetum coccineum TaxID=301880 RepID=A0ABQ5AFW9_9ASTR
MNTTDASKKGLGADVDAKGKSFVFALRSWRHFMTEPMRARLITELLSDYDCEIRYHPGSRNVVVDASGARKN